MSSKTCKTYTCACGVFIFMVLSIGTAMLLGYCTYNYSHGEARIIPEVANYFVLTAGWLAWLAANVVTIAMSGVYVRKNREEIRMALLETITPNYSSTTNIV